MNKETQDPQQDNTETLRAAARGTENPPRKKPGIYAKSFTPEQQDALAEARQADLLAEEIATLRVKIAALLDNPSADPNLILRAMLALARKVRNKERARYGL